MGTESNEMSSAIGSYVRAMVAGDTFTFGRVVNILNGVTPHYVLVTPIGVAYCSEPKILEWYSNVQIGGTVRWEDNEGNPRAGTVENVRILRNTAIVYAKCVLTGQIVPVPIQLIDKAIC